MSPEPGGTGVDRRTVETLLAEENRRFVEARPRSAALTAAARSTMPRGVPMSWMDDLYDHPPVWVTGGSGPRFSDVDGFEYLDLYVADMSAFCGHAPPPVVQAVSRAMGAGHQLLLPFADAVPLAEHLAQRYGLPKWQFTLSATQANTEVVRIARALTGREIVVVFDGKYHGHLDPTLVVLEDGAVEPEYHGVAREVTGTTRVVPFNDLDALAEVLRQRDVAVVLTEPALTNAGFLLPEPGFHDGLRSLTRETGTLLAVDETHTLVTSYAGLTVEWGLDPDFLTLGKAIAGGVPLGTYGMTEEVVAVLDPPEEKNVVSGAAVAELATGGTLFANALSLAAGLAALTEVLTPEAFAHTAALGERLGDGLRQVFADASLAWSANQHGSHAAYFFCPDPPQDGAASRAADDPDLRALIRVFLANRGVWESGWWLGPTVSVTHAWSDVDEYLERMAELVSAVR